MAVKFYKPNQIDSDSTFTFTSADTDNALNIYDNNNLTKLLSSGSDDSTPEVWTIEFGSSRSIDSIHITNHNIKTGTLKYWNGASYVDFSTAISWTANADTANYYSFNSVATTKIQLTMNTTIVVDAEKQAGELRAMQIIGTVERDPSKSDPQFPEKSKKYTTDDNSSIYVFFGAKYKTKMKFNNATENDLTLFRSLKDLGQSFYVYPAGGEVTTTEEGFRTQDMYLVNYINPFRYKLQKGHLTGVGVKIDLELWEAS